MVQVRSIIGQVRPDRQTLLFSATMPNKVEKLVQDALASPVRVTVGEIGGANDDIKQAWRQSSPPLTDMFCQWFLASICVQISSSQSICCMHACPHHQLDKHQLTSTAVVMVQVAEVLEASAKWPWLQSRLAQFIDNGDVLVFASTQARVDELTAQLQGAGIK